MFYFKFSFRVWVPLLNLPKHLAVRRIFAFSLRYARFFDSLRMTRKKKYIALH